MLPFLLFAVWEVPEAFLRFLPFELLSGRHPRGVDDVLKEDWEGHQEGRMHPSPYIIAMSDKVR